IVTGVQEIVSEIVESEVAGKATSNTLIQQLIATSKQTIPVFKDDKNDDEGEQEKSTSSNSLRLSSTTTVKNE
ncbi:7398_t:CDS:1, partial [Funneliformis geosporum]